jgi:hypothetical protein
MRRADMPRHFTAVKWFCELTDFDPPADTPLTPQRILIAAAVAGLNVGQWILHEENVGS